MLEVRRVAGQSVLLARSARCSWLVLIRNAWILVLADADHTLFVVLFGIVPYALASLGLLVIHSCSVMLYRVCLRSIRYGWGRSDIIDVRWWFTEFFLRCQIQGTQEILMIEKGSTKMSTKTETTHLSRLILLKSIEFVTEKV